MVFVILIVCGVFIILFAVARAASNETSINESISQIAHNKNYTAEELYDMDPDKFMTQQTIINSMNEEQLQRFMMQSDLEQQNFMNQMMHSQDVMNEQMLNEFNENSLKFTEDSAKFAEDSAKFAENSLPSGGFLDDGFGSFGGCGGFDGFGGFGMF